MGDQERGLGTALSSILDQWSDEDPERAGERAARLHALIPPLAPAVTPPAPATFSELAALILDVFESLLPLDVCVFAYRPTGEGFRVLGRRRARAHRFDGFRLLEAARAQLDAGDGVDDFLLGDIHCVGVASSGRRSTGLFVLGRCGARLDDDEVRWTVPLGWLLGSVLQAATDLA